MQPYVQPAAPPPRRGLSPLAIILIVLGVILAIGVGTCIAGIVVVKREADKVAGELADGAVIVIGSPPDVTAALAGPKKDLIGSWRSARGSTLVIDAAGNIDLEKDEDGDGNKETFKAAIASFKGDDIELKLLVTVTIHVTRPPTLVGDTWQMTADGVKFERPAAGP